MKKTTIIHNIDKNQNLDVLNLQNLLQDHLCSADYIYIKEIIDSNQSFDDKNVNIKKYLTYLIIKQNILYSLKKTESYALYTQLENIYKEKIQFINDKYLIELLNIEVFKLRFFTSMVVTNIMCNSFSNKHVVHSCITEVHLTMVLQGAYYRGLVSMVRKCGLEEAYIKYKLLKRDEPKEKKVFDDLVLKFMEQYTEEHRPQKLDYKQAVLLGTFFLNGLLEAGILHKTESVKIGLRKDSFLYFSERGKSVFQDTIRNNFFIPKLSEPYTNDEKIILSLEDLTDIKVYKTSLQKLINSIFDTYYLKDEKIAIIALFFAKSTPSIELLSQKVLFRSI